MSSCKCSSCPVKETAKCPKKELLDRAYYFRELLNTKHKTKGTIK